MIACLDVDYREAVAYAAGIAFHDWTDATPATEKVIPVVGVQPYQPGQFFRRELPVYWRCTDAVAGAYFNAILSEEKQTLVSSCHRAVLGGVGELPLGNCSPDDPFGMFPRPPLRIRMIS